MQSKKPGDQVTEMIFLFCLDVRLHLELNLGQTSGVFKSLELRLGYHDMCFERQYSLKG